MAARTLPSAARAMCVGSLMTALGIASTLVSVLMALCLLNRPRFWWQQIVCDSSLYLLPLLASVLLYSLKCLLVRRRSWVLAIVGALSSGYSVFVILSVVAPFLRYDRWDGAVSPSAKRLRLLFVDDCAITPPQARELLDSHNPEVLVVSGAPRETFLASAGRLPYRRDFGGDAGVLVTSSLPLLGPDVPNLGINSRPGGVVVVKLPSGDLVNLGVINLSPAFNQSDFERNRVSARRLASVMRNSDSTRLVIGDFYATPLSQFVSVFTEQARLRSLWYGQGIVKTYDMRRVSSHFTLSHALVSRDLRPTKVERVTIPECSRAALFSELALREQSSANDEKDALELLTDENA